MYTHADLRTIHRGAADLKEELNVLLCRVRAARTTFENISQTPEQRIDEHLNLHMCLEEVLDGMLEFRQALDAHAMRYAQRELRKGDRFVRSGTAWVVREPGHFIMTKPPVVVALAADDKRTLDIEGIDSFMLINR